MATIRDARAAEMETVRALLREYRAEIGLDACFGDFGRELEALPGDYLRPDGRLLVAEVEGQVVGCVALRRAGPETCEMKRLYVRPVARGSGAGRALAARVIGEARSAGYRVMRLDTIPGKMDAAIALYESLGFRDVSPFRVITGVPARFMHLRLTG